MVHSFVESDLGGIDSFPSNLVAGRFGFIKAIYYEIDSLKDRAVPKISVGQVT